MTTWRERVLAAKRRRWFTKGDLTAVAGWSTCAVGEQHAALPQVVLYEQDQDEISGPVDETLHILGNDFSKAVVLNLFDPAMAVLEAIEDRVLELKREV
jgi:hypothetical protein